jgi:hypothetical protein
MAQERRPNADLPVVFGREAPGPPNVGIDFRGIRIQRRQPVPGAPTPSRWIDGVIQLDRADADAMELRPVQRDLVITASAGYHYASWNLGGDRILFPDDEEDLGGVVRGRFGFDLSRFFDDDESCRCSVLASAGPFLSEVIVVEPRGT